MADDRPTGGRGRRGVFRRAKRPSVPATGTRDVDPGDDPDLGGSAGVREPRRPKPSGPLSDAGESPLPEAS